MINNPYIHRGPVTGEMFFGRENELNRILQLLGAFQPQNIAIHGPERIGKSSLLHQLCKVIGPQDLPGRVFVYVDMQGLPDPETFFWQASDRQANDYEEFLEWLEDQAQPIIFCLDEFGKTITKGEFDADFFDALRSVAGLSQVALITSTLLALPELAVPGDPRVSRFFNIFSPMPIGPLTDAEAHQLASVPARRIGVEFSPDEIDYAVQITSRHPFYLQLFCYRLLDAKHCGGDIPLDLAQVEREYKTDLMQMNFRTSRPETPVSDFIRHPLLARLEKVFQAIIGGLALIVAIMFLLAFITNSPQFMVIATILSIMALIALGVGVLASIRRRR